VREGGECCEESSVFGQDGGVWVCEGGGVCGWELLGWSSFGPSLPPSLSPSLPSLPLPIISFRDGRLGVWAGEGGPRRRRRRRRRRQQGVGRLACRWKEGIEGGKKGGREEGKTILPSIMFLESFFRTWRTQKK